jgi:hypothetical protein
MRIFLLFIALFPALLVAEPGTDEIPRSGWLPDEIYDQLEQIETNKQIKARRWLGPRLNFANFQTVMVDEVAMCPEPEPNERVSQETIDAINEFTTRVMRDKVAAVLNLSWEPGPGVLRMRTALVGFHIQTEGMKAYEVLPVTAIFGAAKAITGTRDQDVWLFYETRLEDSETGELVGATMRAVNGDQLKGKKDQLSLDDMKESIDAATDDGNEVFGAHFEKSE